MPSLAIFTIAAPNYLPFVQVLMDSVRRWAPDARRFLILAGPADSFDAAAGGFEVVPSETLPIPSSKWFHFKYSILELSTALKPYAFRFLLDRWGFDEILYFDPDIRIFSSLETILAQLSSRSFVLTPHLTAPLCDGAQPGELEVLRSGAYNLGFIGVRDCAESRSFLEWWQARVYDHCFSDQPNGLFVDQRWLDLAPSLFPEAAILRSPGYNTAYWNLAHCNIEWAPSEHKGFLVNGELLCFFHFSGFDPENPAPISLYQNRYRLEELSEAARSIFLNYAKAVLDHGYSEYKTRAYPFGFFDNGIPIPETVRNVYFHAPELVESIEDPFSEAGYRKICAFWSRTPEARSARRVTGLGYRGRIGPIETGLLLPALALAIYDSRPDVQASFPHPSGKDRVRFLSWLLTFGAAEYKLHVEFLESIQREWDSQIAEMRNPVMKLRYQAQRWAMTLRTNAHPASRRPEAVPPQDAALTSDPVDHSEFGINFFGYVRSEMGVGESGRCAVRAARAAGLPLLVKSVDRPGPYRMLDRSLQDGFIQDPPASGNALPYRFSLFRVNADQAPDVMLRLESNSGKFNIGYWVWELEEFPSRWASSFDFFNEIWTPSSFCAEAFSRKSPIPVVRMPYAIEFDPPPQLGRSAFGLPEDRFLFLFVFDLMSVFERKNPLAAIAAFREAFGNSSDYQLVLKINNGAAKPDEVERIARAASGLPVTILDRTIDRGDVNALVQCCDCLLSLHRSEGYGLTLAEAMYLAKPVIATAYSGNLDFMKPDNSFLVRYRMTSVPPGCAPYDEGLSWADPCLSDAVAQMKTVAAHPEIREERAQAGREFIRTRLSHAAVGEMMKRRLEILQSRVQG